MTTYTVRVVLHGSADHRLGNARQRLSSSLCELRILRGAHCDWIASLLNVTGAIQHAYFDGGPLEQVFADQTVLGWEGTRHTLGLEIGCNVSTIPKK